MCSRIICLCGLMGSGKSTVGAEVAARLGRDFVDLDSYIETKLDCSISHFFKLKGEAAFRKMEKDSLKAIISEQKAIVLSLGGGTLIDEENVSKVRENCLCFWLRASVNTLVSHLKNNTGGRPLLQAVDLEKKLEELTGEREANYQKAASFVIDTDGKAVEDIASEIVSKI